MSNNSDQKCAFYTLLDRTYDIIELYKQKPDEYEIKISKKYKREISLYLTLKELERLTENIKEVIKKEKRKQKIK